MHEFQVDPTVRVALLSIKAAGVVRIYCVGPRVAGGGGGGGQMPLPLTSKGPWILCSIPTLRLTIGPLQCCHFVLFFKVLRFSLKIVYPFFRYIFWLKIVSLLIENSSEKLHI